MARERFKYAGATVKVKDGVKPLMGRVNFAGADFTVEDWWENVFGASWKFATGNPAAMQYAMHLFDSNLPIDDEVVYGKINGLGYILHVSELELPEE